VDGFDLIAVLLRLGNLMNNNILIPSVPLRLSSFKFEGCIMNIST